MINRFQLQAKLDARLELLILSLVLSGKGSHPVQQLKCIDDPAEPLCSRYTPAEVTCFNKNYEKESEEANW